MKPQPKISTTVRVHTMAMLLFLLGFLSVLWFAQQLKAGTHRQQQRAHARVSQDCVKVQCAQVGESATYVISGRVVAVSEPQPGVICVQLGSQKQAGQVCEPK